MKDKIIEIKIKDALYIAFKAGVVRGGFLNDGKTCFETYGYDEYHEWEKNNIDSIRAITKGAKPLSDEDEFGPIDLTNVKPDKIPRTRLQLPEISEGEIEKLSEAYSKEILPHEKKGSQSRCGLEVGFVDGFKAALFKAMQPEVAHCTQCGYHYDSLLKECPTCKGVKSKEEIHHIIDNLQDKHDSWLGHDGEIGRSNFKSGLSWAISSFKTLIE